MNTAQNGEQRPTPEQRVLAQLADQRNRALDALAQAAAEAGALHAALAEAEKRIAELEAALAEPQAGAIALPAAAAVGPDLSSVPRSDLLLAFVRKLLAEQADAGVRSERHHFNMPWTMAETLTTGTVGVDIVVLEPGSTVHRAPVPLHRAKG